MATPGVVQSEAGVHSNTGVIAGVAAGVLLLVIIAVALFLWQRKRPRARSPGSEEGFRAVQSRTSDGARATSPPSTPSSIVETVACTGLTSTSGTLHGGSSSDPSAAAPPLAEAEDIASPINFVWSSATSSIPSTPTAPLLPSPPATLAHPSPLSRRAAAAWAHLALTRQPSTSLSLASARATVHEPSSPAPAPAHAPPLTSEKTRHVHPGGDRPARPTTTSRQAHTHAPSAVPPSFRAGAGDDLGRSLSLETNASGRTAYSVDGGVRLAGGRPGEDEDEDVPEVPPYARGAPTRAWVMPPPYSDLHAGAGDRRSGRGSGGEAGTVSGALSRLG
ncbi:uncharacterized protein BXZ73DRAFT_105408 [Epithele typhae]|uniref:uncharacterized protein n=1 Tax=Epithele typhae TaxID=378194 RepID=UPI0020080EA6|nr:uncharacterized protein BXZ73DRAFT_105408 [Epithele typhae]KAH9917887.1 hypothetical protein BXZ73DRAFT_105408 [Epithele typhae]